MKETDDREVEAKQYGEARREVIQFLRNRFIWCAKIVIAVFDVEIFSVSAASY